MRFGRKPSSRTAKIFLERISAGEDGRAVLTTCGCTRVCLFGKDFLLSAVPSFVCLYSRYPFLFFSTFLLPDYIACFSFLIAVFSFYPFQRRVVLSSSRPSVILSSVASRLCFDREGCQESFLYCSSFPFSCTCLCGGGQDDRKGPHYCRGTKPERQNDF